MFYILIDLYIYNGKILKKNFFYNVILWCYYLIWYLGIYYILENGNKMNVEMYNLIFIKNLNFWEIVLWVRNVEINVI